MTDEIEVNDVGLLDLVTRRRAWEVDKGNGLSKTREQNLQQPIPEAVMAELQEYIGDGQARVTVGGELSHNKDYCKAQAFVSVSAHCGNDEGSISATHVILHNLVRQLLNQDLEDMKQDRDAHIGVPATQGKVSLPPKSVAPKTAPVSNRPSFRR